MPDPIILFVHLAERRHGLDRLVDRHVRLGRYQFRDPVAVAERDVERFLNNTLRGLERLPLRVQAVRDVRHEMAAGTAPQSAGREEQVG